MMTRYALLTLVLLLCQSASAFPLHGLNNFEEILGLLIAAVIGIVLLVFSLLTMIVNRLAEGKFKVSIGVNFSCCILIMCTLLLIGAIGEGIDRIFLLSCIGVILISSLLIVFNYKFRAKQKDDTDSN